MKQLSVFLLILLLACTADLNPVDIESMRSNRIHVTIRGEVEQEGEYELEQYSTMQDALEAAGLTEQSDTGQLNPMTILKDHDVITVAKQESSLEKSQISINSATVEELCTLNGIGEATAQAIIQYREENGLFQTLEDLMRVKGIGEGKFAKIRDDICL